MEGDENEDNNRNPSVNDYKASDIEKIKGDAIGDTMYSERWVIKTLMKIHQFKEEDWNDDFETDLCSLWDMTSEKDVIHLLMNHDVVMIISSLLYDKAPNSRLTEILVGIVGNMCCDASVRQVVSQRSETISLFFALFDQLDAHVLIQLIRIFHSFAWDLIQHSGTAPKWLEEAIQNSRFTPNFSFILKSSTNDELLSCLLDFLNTTCTLEIDDKDFSQFFASPEMVSGMIDAWEQLFSDWQHGEDFPNRSCEKAASHWCGILSSFSGHEEGRGILNIFSEKIGAICYKIINRPVENLDAILISSVSLLDSLLPKYFNESVLKQLLLILNILYQNQGETSESSLNSENLELILQDSIESYCANVSISVPRQVLNHILAECSENHVFLFWKAVSEKQIDDTGERAV